MLLAAPYLSQAGPIVGSVPAIRRTPTASELTGLDSNAFDTFFSVDLPFTWGIVDSSANGWIIGVVGGQPGYSDVSFVFHRGLGVTCCRVEELNLTDINSAGVIVGNEVDSIPFYGPASAFDGVPLSFCCISDYNFPANAPLFDEFGHPWEQAGNFHAISEDGQRIQTGAGVLYLTAPTPESSTWFLMGTGMLLILLGKCRKSLV
jgi:hypothetical protein